MTTMIQPAMTLPQQAYMPMQGQAYGPAAMPVGMPQAMGMGQAPMMAAPAMGQPVYFSSMSQLPPGVMPVSQQVLAQALGQGAIGAEAVQPSSSPLRSMLAGAALGAVGGFGASLLLPFGPVVGAIAGAAIGGGAGLLLGIRRRRSEEQFHTMRQQEAQSVAQGQAAQVGASPAGSQAIGADAANKKGVVMGPEMRRRWAAKVRAERAAAAAAGAR